MIEVYLNSKDENLRFPVVPPTIGKIVNADITTEKIVKKGGINIYNGTTPDSVSISHFFPSKNATDSYIDVQGVDPYDYVEKLETWCKRGERLRYIVTDTPINMQVRISHFEFKESDSTGDVYYTIDLKEDEDIKIPEWTPPPMKKTSDIKIVQNKKRSDTKKDSKSRIHIVKKNDYLFMIAKKYYGDGSKYPKIKNNAENQKKYPKLKHSNVIYIGWKLVIP